LALGRLKCKKVKAPVGVVRSGSVQPFFRLGQVKPNRRKQPSGGHLVKEYGRGFTRPFHARLEFRLRFHVGFRAQTRAPQKEVAEPSIQGLLRFSECVHCRDRIGGHLGITINERRSNLVAGSGLFAEASGNYRCLGGNARINVHERRLGQSA